MFKINNFTNNDDVAIISEKGPFQVIQYKRTDSLNHFYTNIMKKNEIIKCDNPIFINI